MAKVIDSRITWNRKLSCGHVCKMFGRQWKKEAKIAISTTTLSFDAPSLANTVARINATYVQKKLSPGQRCYLWRYFLRPSDNISGPEKVSPAQRWYIRPSDIISGPGILLSIHISSNVYWEVSPCRRYFLPGPSTEGGWRETVSKLGQGGSLPPPELVRSTHECCIT